VSTWVSDSHGDIICSTSDPLPYDEKCTVCYQKMYFVKKKQLERYKYLAIGTNANQIRKQLNQKALVLLHPLSLMF
jgi:predicted DCC family thiol-disulfide oxidoreductase YuxK